MEMYRRTRTKQDDDDGASPENQVRIMVGGRIHAYIKYALNILEDESKPEGVALLGLGNAINKTVTVSELLRRLTPGLHQVTELSSVEIKDHWEPLEEGLKALETVRSVSSVRVHLSKQPLDQNAPGYQPPIPVEDATTMDAMVEELSNIDRHINQTSRRGRGGRRGRGRRGASSSAGGGRGEAGAAHNGAAERSVDDREDTGYDEEGGAGSTHHTDRGDDRTEFRGRGGPRRSRRRGGGRTRGARGEEAAASTAGAPAAVE